MSYAQPSVIRRQILQLLRPPKRVKVSDAARDYVRIGTGGNNSKAWDADATPYMIEPMDCLNDRRYHTVCFTGPARTGKTQALLDCWIAYVMACDPGDMMILHTSQDAARDYSRRRVDRLFRHSPQLAPLMSTWGHADNTFDKTMASGAILSIGWPTIRQLSSRDIKYMAITDYDRGREDIDGEGDKYSMAQKRTETFLSSGRTLVESSPGYDWIAYKWEQQTPHELPPSPGIVQIYNRGDRRRFYWQCLGCNGWFIPEFNLLHWDDKADPSAASKTARLACPHCGELFEHKHKRIFNKRGRWLIEGQRIDSAGNITGDARQSRIASFHMTGVMAAFQTWESLAYKFLTAKREYDETGDEKALRATVLLDQGMPYKPQRRRQSRDAGHLQARAQSWPKHSVPGGVRFLIAAIDVQSNRFVVQVVGYGRDRQRWLIDRFELARSNRGGKPVEPAAYAEDWQLITPLLTKKYDLADGTGRQMKIMIVGCDSGGLDGVAVKIYDYWRSLQKLPGNLHKKFLPLKGVSTIKDAYTRISYPDTTAQKERGASRGDVPVLLVNVDRFKDELDNDLRREDQGPGYIHFPAWLPGNVFDELTNEEKDERGNWKATGRNEAIDLFVYAEALGTVLNPRVMEIDWNAPPPWADDWVKNTMVIDEAQKFATPKQASRRLSMRAVN